MRALFVCAVLLLISGCGNAAPGIQQFCKLRGAKLSEVRAAFGAPDEISYENRWEYRDRIRGGDGKMIPVATLNFDPANDRVVSVSHCE